ncbi:hypothetical protein LB521_01200 [Mesorhizobium sp. BR-1-1-8]|uniref:hypothetical protein n=1 Tax=Mesorhizobium sp. BR-1-1-8 TaxID=2876659 RepID=UPI001CCFDA85|nr:hypothetical protein [Mesorhizobium sp. BR-1-1-8]MBZ9979764.1 hypothetical protein [Mesorhizobium sp. BR-1-1-8]
MVENDTNTMTPSDFVEFVTKTDMPKFHEDYGRAVNKFRKASEIDQKLDAMFAMLQLMLSIGLHAAAKHDRLDPE